MSKTKSSSVLPPGMEKVILRHPSTTKQLPPQLGDEVEVHCVGTLLLGDATFEDSRARDKPIVYKVGGGEVISGWDHAVMTMMKGEKSTFTVPAELAYGKAGLGTIVPPDNDIVLEIELLKCPIREDLFEDGGVIKLEMKEGTGFRQPRVGDECQISYKVTVEGCGVAMAAQHAVYRVGNEQMGQIAVVLDSALKTMKRGDEAIMTCQPKYGFGYGEGQFAGKVARVLVILEEIYEVYDMSRGERDKTVLRKRVKEGEGGEKADKVQDLSEVKIRVLSATSRSESLIDAPIELSFVVGNGEVCDALEACVGMKKGEEALIRCESSEACQGGLLGLPAGLATPVMIKVVVLSFTKALEKWDMKGRQRLDNARLRRETAADLFKRGRVRLAAQHYEAIADLFVSMYMFSDEEQVEASELRRLANLNRAMCMLKMGNLTSAETLCTTVLIEDPGNVKARYRRAKARLEQMKYEGAIDDLRRLLEVDPSNAEAQKLLREARRLEKSTDRREAKTFAKMCEGLGQLPERTRKDDDIVVMPDIEAEYARIAAKFTRNLPRSADTISSTPMDEQVQGDSSSA